MRVFQRSWYLALTLSLLSATRRLKMLPAPLQMTATYCVLLRICCAGRVDQGQVRGRGVAGGSEGGRAGAPGVYISTWYGLWVPKGTPPEAIRKLTIAAMDALVDPTVRQRLTDLGQEIPPPEQQTAEALAAHQKAEIEKWWPLIKAANVKAE